MNQGEYALSLSCCMEAYQLSGSGSQITSRRINGKIRAAQVSDDIKGGGTIIIKEIWGVKFSLVNSEKRFKPYY